MLPSRRIGGQGGFGAGLVFGRQLFADTEQSRRQDEYDQQRRDEVAYVQEQRARMRGIQADDAYTANRGMTGVTPNMTQPGQGGMGPVADPRDLDWQYNPSNPNATTAPPLPAAASDGQAGLAPPVQVADASGGLPESFGQPDASADTTVAAGRALAPPRPRVPLAAPGGVGKPATAPLSGGVQPTDGGMSDAEQTDRIAASQLKQGNYQGFYASKDRAKAQAMDQAMQAEGHRLITMSDDDLYKEASKYVTANKNIHARLNYDPQTHQFTVIHDNGTIDPPMNGAQARITLLHAFEVGHGDVKAGLEGLYNIGEKVRAQTNEVNDRENVLTAEVGKQGLAIDKSKREDDLARAKINLEAAQANRMYKLAEKQGQGMKLQPGVVYPDGRPVWMDHNGNGPDGNKVDLTKTSYMKDPGFNAPPNRAEVMRTAAQWVTDGHKTPDGKRVQTYDENLQEIYNGVENVGPRGTGPAGLKPSDLEASTNALVRTRATREAAAREVPPMPPQMIGEGGVRQLNPEYVDWMRRYGNPGPTLESGPTPRSLTTPTAADIQRTKRSGYQ